MKIDLTPTVKFEDRHNGPSTNDVSEMLTKIGAASIDELIDQTIPKAIQLDHPLNLPEAKSEATFLKDFRKMAAKNKIYKSFIGLGYYDTITPGVILRNVLENPGWYTAYTPYQAEIAQGRLEALVNFQTMVMDLTGMELANASLLDEGTAAAEAMNMLFATRPRDKKKATKFFVDEKVFIQTKEILKTRALPIGVTLVEGPLHKLNLEDPELYGVLLQYPNADGEAINYKALIETAKENSVTTAFSADLLALTLLTPPGEMGADVVVGTTQRFGVPMGYGGPHAAYFATKDTYKRQVPGRIIGISVDRDGNKAYRMALQTREQHIKRERATSNICTAQVLLAVMAGMYAVYHGPKGLKDIALKIHGLAKLTAQGLAKLGFEQENENYFDTLKIKVDDVKQSKIKAFALSHEMNFRYEPGYVYLAFDEAKTVEDVQEIIEVFARTTHSSADVVDLGSMVAHLSFEVADGLKRTSDYMGHMIFNAFHSEHEMLRYIKRLENRDLSLVHSMISLGSCTMKLNATAEMIPVTWPEFGQLHPFVPQDQAAGYYALFQDLRNWLSEITGFAETSLQPNSGAQGEFAGLMVIRAYHESRGESHRNIALIPSSAHGTNPASAVMAGMKVVIVKCDDKGNIDLGDLKEKAEKHKDNLSSFLVTYPSTHGVFEEAIREMCQIVHENGGQVYMDGANMNAQVGLTSPGVIGADVCHLNLHKTFCIPHGGGGPGMGPICVAKHLEEFLPSSPLVKTGGQQPISAISAAPFGSASILPISYAYIAMMGREGLKHATQTAILNANYIKARLGEFFPTLYTGAQGRAAHEMIVDFREFKAVGVEVEDIAKRLIDYGFHSPTVSFPVAGTMMIEPTESESKAELDRFCDALISIRGEIREIEEGKADPENNVLKNAPHTAGMVMSDDWDLPYSREKAVYPLDYVKNSKFWPTVRRIDSAYGDRNLVCSCIPTEDYEEASI
ncbi:glycine dehydrogenase (aminomethyl-transferring) [Echinicola strongylocentroti]|uniref:Glycine dehydrogenase (decarboxylating) n=1 Tax=Echinicola strongylocentroti TaxID=1795355 RepID=A0A2Z4II74_9BACT|nr:aminomethyl-transferring glycine dehydrogenase [Echinicola strongylocentroti]AWW30439.1 glycine dehydrogenase (aminomethyl-transferring) [Echinicola strongylocentroti]